MKAKSIFLVAALLIVSTSLMANEAPSNVGVAVIPVKGTEVFKVIYKSETAGRVKLSVYNAGSKLIFTETLASATGFIRPLNFNGLAAGDYTIELSDANGKTVEKISYQPETVTNHFNVSKLASESSKYVLTVVSSGTDKISINIYDAFGNLVHDEVKEVTGSMAQLYTIKNSNGAYTFVVSDSTGKVKRIQF